MQIKELFLSQDSTSENNNYLILIGNLSPYINVERHDWSHSFALLHWRRGHKHHCVAVKSQGVICNYPPVSGWQKKEGSTIQFCQCLKSVKIILPSDHYSGEGHVHLVIRGLTNEARHVTTGLQSTPDTILRGVIINAEQTLGSKLVF